MATLEILLVENKDRLKEVRVRDVVTGQESDAAVWKTDKDGREFPNYDLITPGNRMEGNLWTNPKNGSRTIYPLSPKKTASYSKGNIAQAQERKANDIQEAQTRKENAIELAGTARDATLLTVAWVNKQSGTVSVEEIEARWLKFREWLTSQFGTTNLPF